jgi:hypothetical protein
MKANLKEAEREQRNRTRRRIAEPRKAAQGMERHVSLAGEATG